MDKGPWTVSENDDRINSDDFTHDASLILYGDFAPENRRPYLEFIAKELNDCSALRARVAKLESYLLSRCFHTDEPCGEGPCDISLHVVAELRRRAGEG
jgi:hypothetical protein